MELANISQERYDRARIEKKERVLSMLYNSIEYYERHVREEGVS